MYAEIGQSNGSNNYELHSIITAITLIIRIDKGSGFDNGLYKSSACAEACEVHRIESDFISCAGT